ncbi:MAG: hypothetical protein IKC59_03370 [Clostridia bacterium]|nr:hypothetical protein [Clostridia bacterium]
MKRILAILLVFCMVLPFAACNGGKDTPEETKNNQTPNGDVAFNEQEYLNSLPIINFDGEEFKVLCTTQTASEPENFFDVFEETSDVVESAVFRRNSAVEERFDLTMKYNALPGNRDKASEFSTEIRTSVDAGAGLGYDLIVAQNYYALPTSTEGYLHNLLGTNQLHWDMEWYNADINENGVINDKLYGASGTFNMSQISYAMAVFFNKNYYESMGLEENLYDLVRNKKWTYEKLYELTAEYYEDNGTLTGAVDNEDTFGYVYNSHGVEASIVAADCPVVFTNSDGSLTIDDYYNIHLVDVFEDYYHYFNECNGVRRLASDEAPSEQIGKGKALFANNRIGMMVVCDEMRNSDFDIGVLPMPLFDENQDDYYTSTMRWELFYIPSNADLEKSAIVLEYLNYSSEKHVLPAYWETALNNRANAAEDSEMLHLVRDTLYYDFATFFGFAMGGIYGGPYAEGGVKELIETGNKGLSRWWQQNLVMFRTSLEDVLDSYG